MVSETISRMLAKSGAAYTLHEHPPIVSLEEADRLAPHLTRHLLKTIVFRIKGGMWVLAAVEGSARIHYRKLADALGVKRTALRSISPQQVESELGFQVGGVGPFPVCDDVKVLFDSALSPSETIFCGSGRNTHTIEIRLADLISISGGERHPIQRAPS
ncbi:MAG: YbaK/EbsC family protein [Desulfosarcinaceae bacterium]|nr:YbaK/EbsC family protein [Desulfosarcinaceae bacterium]